MSDSLSYCGAVIFPIYICENSNPQEARERDREEKSSVRVMILIAGEPLAGSSSGLQKSPSGTPRIGGKRL
jgi:hypothetical protein